LVACSVFSSFAQLQIQFPVSRAVFQRGNNGRGTFTIAGNYFQPLDQIQARVTALQGGNSTDWTPIQNNPQGGNFMGTLNVAGGWYRLEVRGLQGGNPVGSPATVDRVGVGEVFILAGQSNAQGIDPIPSGQIEPEDRVIAVNYDNSRSHSLNDPPFPTFNRMPSGSYYSMRGVGSWAWGWLGNQIAQRFNVPVLFINTAFAGTQIDAWVKSAQGLPAPNIFCQSCADPNYPSGMPYGNLKIALQYYGSMLGLRAVLWMQGETDNTPLGTSTDSYRDALKFVISKSRNDTGKELSWVVSQTSHASKFNEDGSYNEFNGPQITSAQLQVVQQMSNVFLGPNTDNIQIPRPVDGTHFRPVEVPGTGKNGHQLLGEAWNEALSTDFFANSNPQPAAGLVPTTIACAGPTAYQLSISGNEPRWSTGEQSGTITAGRGVYYGRVRDGAGNILLSQPVLVAVPTVQAQGSTEFCQGGNVRLVADVPTNIGFTWSTGATGREITVTSSGTYRVSFRDQVGCTLESSVQVTVNPLPDKPRIAAQGPTEFCQTDPSGTANSVTLTAPANNRYQWTLNGAAPAGDTRELSVAASGRYSLEVIDAKGCRSPVSDPVNVLVNPNPAKPTITAGGPTLFCANESVLLTSTASDSTNYLWNNGLTSRARSVRVNQGGQYTVRTTNRFGCVSVASDPLLVRVNPLPDRPVVTASGALSFCEEQSVILCTNSPLRQAWVEATDSTRVLASAPCFTATRTGNYQVRVTDANGCRNFSQSVPINVRPIPTQPSVAQIGAFTLRAEGTQPGQSYVWYLNSDSLRGSRYRTQIIKTPQEGIYQTTARITYSGVPNLPGGLLTCFSRISLPVFYTYDQANPDDLVVYPNPNLDGNFTIETKSDLTNATISVYTLRGELLFQETVPALDERKFLRLNPTPGTYIIRVASPDGFSVTERVMVVR